LIAVRRSYEQSCWQHFWRRGRATVQIDKLA
jgi:hypothetical protein